MNEMNEMNGSFSHNMSEHSERIQLKWTNTVSECGQMNEQSEWMMACDKDEQNDIAGPR